MKKLYRNSEILNGRVEQIYYFSDQKINNNIVDLRSKEGRRIMNDPYLLAIAIANADKLKRRA